MDQTSMSAEIMEHARGAVIFEVAESGQSVSGTAAYQCKLYRAQLDLASASQLPKLHFVRNRTVNMLWKRA